MGRLESSYNLYRESVTLGISRVLSGTHSGLIVDAGCGDASLTRRYIATSQDSELVGLEFDPEACKLARQKFVQVIRANVERALPIRESSVDVLIANQVIEHLEDPEHFVRDAYRIMKTGARIIISTPNISSWHNIFALVVGFQDFSTHIATRYLGNPLSPHYRRPIRNRLFLHRRTFALRALSDILTTNGFKIEKKFGSGYVPFRGVMAKALERVDPIHSHFISIVARKR